MLKKLQANTFLTKRLPHRNLTTVQRKKAKAQLLTMCALLLLGFGNYVYGKVKYDEYAILLQDISPRARVPDIQRRFPVLAPTLDIGQEAQHRTRLESRLEFYSLVTLGGKCFLVLAGVFFLLVLVTLRTQPETPPPSTRSN